MIDWDSLIDELRFEFSPIQAPLKNFGKGPSLKVKANIQVVRSVSPLESIPESFC